MAGLAALAAISFTSCAANVYERWTPRYTADELEVMASGLAAGFEPEQESEHKLTDQRKRELKVDEPQSIHENQYKQSVRRDKEELAQEVAAIDEDECDDDSRARLRRYNSLKLSAVSETASDKQLRKASILNGLKLLNLYGDERGEIEAADRNPRIGLALSGGGVRSASFATGVLQALHEIGVLDQVGYMSTVSGGGYAGSWYMLHRDNDEELFDLSSSHQQHLAQNGTYLSSGHASGSISRMGYTVLGHFALLPLHWLVNGVFDWDVNTPHFRDQYRNGIIRAFMYYKPLANEFGGDFSAWKSMAEFRPTQDEDEHEDCHGHVVPHVDKENRPWWIINMHLALNDDPDNFRDRSGDAFELTPLRAGADSVGYVNVEPIAWSWSEKLGRNTPLAPPDTKMWMSPAYAVAASGAAVDSRSGIGNIIQTQAMRVANLDLGYYIEGWSPGFNNGSSRNWWHRAHFMVTSPWPIYGLLGRIISWNNIFGNELHGQRVEGRKYYITDGGHFENLGLYALVRRGCRLIIVSDAAQDANVAVWDDGSPESRSKSFGDLRRFERILRTDFGAELEMEWSEFSPSPTGNTRWQDKGGFRSVFMGKIRNLPTLSDSHEAVRDVRIIYIKSAYEQRNGLRTSMTNIDAEKIDCPDYPNESTANQNFSEEKVIAYRSLAREMVLSHRDAIQAEVADMKEECRGELVNK
ncbi:MAG: putative acylesterase/phospholipase RssA [Planctomycetota bacterium]|jgi:predicted acylesterase/phospholipase RssA